MTKRTALTAAGLSADCPSADLSDPPFMAMTDAVVVSAYLHQRAAMSEEWIAKVPRRYPEPLDTLSNIEDDA